jgi:hypothetical protein
MKTHSTGLNGAALVVAWLLVFAYMCAGCTGGGGTSPVAPPGADQSSPQLTSSSNPDRACEGRVSWGFWDAILDKEAMTVEFVPVRTGSIHLNVVTILNSTMGISAHIDPADSNPSTGLFAIDVSLTHPFSGKPQFSGFDVKGILITPGTTAIGQLIFAGPGETSLVNADGCSRWWNPSEFPGPALSGYRPGILGSQNSALLTATVNPYKYFCDFLTSEQDLIDLTSVPLDDDLGRGVFSSGATNTRRYLIRFPMSPGPQIVFNYAVDASWKQPVPNPPTQVPDDFPMDANQSEAYCLVAGADVNTLAVDEGGVGGGVLRVSIDVYDWQGQSSGSISDEISSVRVYAPELFPDGQTMNLSYEDAVMATYSADLSGLAAPAVGGMAQVIMGVESADGLHYSAYAPGGPDEPVSAYQVLWVPVAETVCMADSNNDFPEAAPIGWGESVHGLVCRPGGVLTDYVDYYTFEIAPDNSAIGEANLYAWSTQVTLSLFDGAFAKLTQSDLIGGVATIDLGAQHLLPGTYYLRILTQNEADTVYYQLDLDAEEIAAAPAEFIGGITGPVYPRTMQISSYQVNVDSAWPVTYSWKVQDPGGWVFAGPDPGDGNGRYYIRFNDVWCGEGSASVTCEASNGLGAPVSTGPYQVWVNGRIFHADLEDEVTGDNAGWSTTGQYGTSSWSAAVVTDDRLQGSGRKFGPPSANYDNDSGDILVSPPISLPPGMGEGIAVFRHSFDLDLMLTNPDEYFRGYDGGNVKITEAPTVPDFGDPPAPIEGGRPYWCVLNAGDTQMEDQQAFAGHSGIGGWPFELVTSVAEIPPAFAGTDIYLGFAATTGFMWNNYRGWLIDDVAVYVEGDVPNSPPVVGAMEGGNLIPGLSDPLHYLVSALDPDGDRVFRTWTLYDFSNPPRWVRPDYYDSTGFAVDFAINTLMGYGYGNRFHVGFWATDGFNDIVIRDAWTVGDGFLFRWDPNDPSQLYDSANFDVAFDDGSDSTWVGPLSTDGILGGVGYKFADPDTDYTPDDHSVLFTPPVIIPPGFSGVLVGFAHYYQFYDDDPGSVCVDGGNVHIVHSDTYDTEFNWTDPPIDLLDAASDYDCELDPSGGALLAGQQVFCDDELPALIRVSYHILDSSWFGDPGSIRLGFAAATSPSGVAPRRGWLIDEVAILGIP